MAGSEIEPRFFTVCVFQDAAWATKGVGALRAQGFQSEEVSLLAKDAPDVKALMSESLGVEGSAIDVNGLGAVVAHGSLVDALEGEDHGLRRTGIAATIRRVGFQAHDGFIFQTLTDRGGVLVAVDSQSRAADALAVFHSYGGGNAAIGAWGGRV